VKFKDTGVCFEKFVFDSCDGIAFVPAAAEQVVRADFDATHAILSVDHIFVRLAVRFYSWPILMPGNDRFGGRPTGGDTIPEGTKGRHGLPRLPFPVAKLTSHRQ